MRDKKYTLTISILASNRKDTLPKTLKSLKPILDNVSSELIVTDTGCDEEMLEIIRQYTDKIIRFEWCKDFSKARNVGIDVAQGEWFMYIDDDEWFEDVTEFIEFFNSAQKDKYGYAKYYQRNYKNMEGSVWSDFAAGRAFRLNEGTKFVDAIHERPINISGPVKIFGVYAHHYGYVYKTEEEKMAHIERNMSLLKEQVKRQPKFARHYAHLIQEYCSTKEYDKIIEVAKSGIEQADMSDFDNQKNVPGLYGAIGWALVNQGKYEDVLIKAKKYIAMNYCNKLCEATWLSFCVTASNRMGRYNECIDYVKRYFEVRDYLLGHEEEYHSMSTAIIVYGIEKENCDRVALIGAKAALYTENVKTFNRCMEFVNFEQMIYDATENEIIATLRMAILCDMDVVKWIEGKKLAWWMSLLDKWECKAKVAELIQTKIELAKALPCDSLYMQYYDVVFTEGLLFRKKTDNMSLDEIKKEVDEYVKIVIGFYSNIYKENIFEQYSTMLPARAQVALFFKELCTLRNVDNNDKKKKILGLMPRFKNVIRRYEEVVV